MDKIVLEPLFHKGKNCIAFKPGMTEKSYLIIKGLPNVLYTKTHSRWYLVNDNPSSFNSIFEAFNKEKIFVDYSALKKKNEVSNATPSITVKKESLSDQQSMALTLMTQKLSLRGYSSNTAKT